jgi:hypothetical protein
MHFSATKSEGECFAVKVLFSEAQLVVQLSDGREIRVPLEFYPKLKNATKQQRENYKLIGLGTGIHWPDIDEDLTVEGLLLGTQGKQR